MDERLQKIIDEAQIKYGLDAYQLERHAIYKERDHAGKAFYALTMEWFPKELTEPLDEDYNPDGTAVIEYNIGQQQFNNVSFVQGISFSTVTHFPTKQVDEVTRFIEEETGLKHEADFKLVDAHAHGFRYESFIEGVSISPICMIEVDFDESGKLTSYHKYGEIPVADSVEKSKFTLTLEEIEPLVKKQLRLVNYPSEQDRSFVPVYGIEEVFVTMDGTGMIAVMEHERTQVDISQVLEWTEPLEVEISREEVTFVCEASAEEAFGNVGVGEKLMLTDEQIERIKIVVCDVMRVEYPDESGKWKLESLRVQENFIEAHCEMIGEDSSIFNRKVVVFIDGVNMEVLNFVDNGALFEIFESFTVAEEAVVTHDEAFEKMLSYISLDPTYLYDKVTEKYILCGLLDATEAVDAITGEIISLSEM